MKIIIAPTKKMVVNTNDFEVNDQPEYLSEAREILAKMKTLSYEQAKQMWACSDKLAQTNYTWLKKMNLDKQQTPAILSYSGIQYQYMAPDLFTAPALNYVQQNLRILSGFYGILRPFDGIIPYRLEMQSQISVASTPNLYTYWTDKLYQSLYRSDDLVLNLASLEYAKSVKSYLTTNQKMIDVIFADKVDGKLKVKATLAKMARGEMVRYLAEHNVHTIQGVTQFDHPDWHYDAEHSDDQQLLFIRQSK